MASLLQQSFAGSACLLPTRVKSTPTSVTEDCFVNAVSDKFMSAVTVHSLPLVQFKFVELASFDSVNPVGRLFKANKRQEVSSCGYYSVQVSTVSIHVQRIGGRQGTRLVIASMRDGSETNSLADTESASFVRSTNGKETEHFTTNLVLQRDSNCAVEAGRSKGKKGGKGAPGGKIERRPLPPQKIPRKKSGSVDMDSTRSEAKGEGTSRKQEGDDDEAFSRFLKEDAKSSSGTEVRRTKLVGGWGRDKSMQREVPVTSEAKIRGAKSGSSATGEQKRTTPGTIPPMPIDDLTVRYPDEYYIDGPFGPYAWRGQCIGKTRRRNPVDNTEKVDRFSEDIGVLYYYVFARSKFLPRENPWKDWTLAAQVAVESGEELDQRVLFSRLTPIVQDIMMKCVAWVRPDLVYVRKPKFQLRLEPQDKFVPELLNLLDKPDTLDSYYGKLCNMLRVQPTSSSTEVRAAYVASSEKKKLECLEHLLTQHPVDLLPSAGYDREAQPASDNKRKWTWILLVSSCLRIPLLLSRMKMLKVSRIRTRWRTHLPKH
ncbi:hypothetical protein R1sor_015857 [Riccia sorocarpa]|uniref:Uncharacterized protein n=1 Tax=Riccia sorocarpa TaxID=122646 RepID=A0ABD3HDR6_9MARC